MSINVVIPVAQQIADGVWRTELPPHEVRMFAENGSAQGEISVIMLSDFEYDKSRSSMTFRLADARAINIGTTETSILISGKTRSLVVGPSENDKKSNNLRAPGDLDFIRLVKMQCPKLLEVAEALLNGVRARSAGELKRGKSRNYSETPDNFWYVIVQNRIEELSITVRGPLDHFEGVSTLEIKDDRGNTRFKVKTISDVNEALKLIFHAKRKM